MLRVCRWLIFFLIAAFLALFLLAPVAGSLVAGCSWELLGEAVRHPVVRSGLINAVAVATLTTGLAFLLALPLAVLSSRTRFAGQRLAEALVLLPLVTPPFTGALGLAQVFGRFGVLNSLGGWQIDWLGQYRFLAVCVVEALHLYPLLYLTLSANLSRHDDCLLEAARMCGASPWQRFRRVTLPLLRPGLFAGGILVFISSLTELGTPLLLDYHRIAPVQIYDGLSDILTGNRLPFAQMVILLVLAAVAYGLGRWLVLGRAGAAAAAGKSSGAGARPRRLSGMGTLGAWLVFGAVFGLAALPQTCVALIATHRDWYASILPRGFTLAHFNAALSHPLVVSSIRNSLLYAGLATVLAGIVGTLVAWITERWRPTGARLLDLVATAPLAIPGLILAFGYLALVARVPILHRLIDPIRDPTILLVIAYAVRRLPYVTRAAAAGFQQLGRSAEEAAATLGAGALTRFRRIVLPLIAVCLIPGLLLTFSFSMLEVADSLILAQKAVDYPITKVIYELTALLGPGPVLACAFSTWAMVFLALAIATARTWGQSLNPGKNP